LALRTLIEQRLRRPRSAADPRERALANVIGPVSADFLALISGPMQRAAVLLALVEHAEGLNVLFTERATHLKHHAGQISFPGGRIEGDRETAVEAALREAHEEIGLEPQDVAIAGALDTLVTGTGFSVTPVVGFVGAAFVAQPDPAEVAAVFEVPHRARDLSRAARVSFSKLRVSQREPGDLGRDCCDPGELAAATFRR
jgi:8-oxo-dGTP pyrophosphatase MutT (NUDIX family)